MRFPDPNIASQARDLVQEAAFKTAPHNRRALAIVNPKSGRGRAPHMYQNVIKPVLQCACINVREFITESPGHATEFMQNTSSSDDIDLIITVGGDGTTNEVLQGMLSREDWERFCTIPILQVPCGTGNALAASSCNWDVLTAVHTAIKGQVRPLDVASFVQVALPRRFSFLSVTYGLISSLDVGTEHLRWIGDARFTLGAVYQIMRQKKYRVRAAYVEHVEGRAQMTQREDVIQGNQSQQAKEEKEEKKIEGGGKPSQSAAGIIDSTDQHVYQEDQDADLRNPLSKDLFLDRYGTEKVAGKPMPKSSERALSSVHNGLSTDLDMGPGPSMEYLDDFKVLCRGDIDEMDAECALNPHGGARKSTSSEIANIAGNSGRSADDDAIGSERSQWQRNLPSCWHVLPADHVQLFAACNLPRLDMNFHFSPESDLSNGHWNLIYTTGKAGRIRGLQLLSASETGKHLDDPFVMHQKIKALFLHPLAHEGICTVFPYESTRKPFFSLYLPSLSLSP